MSGDLISPVLNQLSDLIVTEANLLGGGVTEEIQHIADELGHIKAFLMFAEGREEEDPRLQQWVSQVRDVAYDIQDVVDEFMLSFRHHHGDGLYERTLEIFNSVKNWPAVHQIGREIQEIKSRITRISERHNRYQSEYGSQVSISSSSSVAVDNSWHHYKDEALLVEETKLVGIDQPKQQLISQLLDGDNSMLKVVSVWGMGGLGKTTLVRKVQQDPEVKRQFQIIVWVTVSQTWDMEELLRDLIRRLYKEIQRSVPEEVTSITTTYELKEHVKVFLQDKKYLIVFDDVWHANFWDAIKVAMPEGGGGNRVMLTTRIDDAARAPNVEFQSYVHQMKPLSFDDSWTLFCKKTFKDNCAPAHLKIVAKEILKRCKGLPLGIVAIGGLLALKGQSKIDEWKMVERSLGSELESSGKLNPITKILSFSYNELPYYLKTCLLYASIFPEDYHIQEERLIRFWIAEGFVVEKIGMTKYEVARTYLADLTNRSLIQVTTRYHDRTKREYHIHDLLREIILSKLSIQNFATLATGEQRTWPRKVRRLAIHDFKFDTKEESICFKHLRSFVIFKSNEPLLKSLLSKLLCGGCRLLKVLDLQGTELEEIPEQVLKLFSLKTLSLSGTRVIVIPKSIGSLKNLEYLDLSFTMVKELPEEILKIQGLTHLNVFSGVKISDSDDSIGFKGPKNMAKLLSLECLNRIEANEIIIREMGELKKLEKLGICGLRREDGKQLCSSLAKLSNLKDLCLFSRHDQEVLDLEDMNNSLCSSLQNLYRLDLWGRLEKIPQLLPSLQGLTALGLSWSRLAVDPLESLQHLPSLLTLVLNQAFEGEILCFKAGCFLKLQSLCLWRLHSLRSLRVEEGAMPNLEELRLESLKLLEEFPWGVQHLKKLQSLYLEEMSDKVIVQLQNQDEKSEDYKKIRHIPRIIIWDEDEDGWGRHPQPWKRRKL